VVFVKDDREKGTVNTLRNEMRASLARVCRVRGVRMMNGWVAVKREGIGLSTKGIRWAGWDASLVV